MSASSCCLSRGARFTSWYASAFDHSTPAAISTATTAALHPPSAGRPARTAPTAPASTIAGDPVASALAPTHGDPKMLIASAPQTAAAT